MFGTPIKIIFIIIVTACSVIGQAVTIQHIDVDSIVSSHKKMVEFGATYNTLKLSTYGNNSSYCVASIKCENNVDSIAILTSRHLGDFDLIFNKTYSNSKYKVDGYYRNRTLISDYANSYLLNIYNKDTNQTNSLIIDFSNEPDTEIMFTFQYALKDSYSRIFIHNDILYIIAIGDNQDILYILKINLLNNKIIKCSKFNMNKTYEQLEITHPYNIYSIDDSTFFLAQTNQIYKISVPDIFINKFTFSEAFRTLDVIKDNDSYTMALISDNNTDGVYLINTDNKLKHINWSYQVNMKGTRIINLYDKGKIFKKNDKILFIPLADGLSTQRYSKVIELDYLDKFKSKAWGFKGMFQDIRKINDEHFKITGTVRKDLSESEEAIFYGDLYFDGSGDCPLDTACLQIDTLEDFTITAIDDIVFEDADILLEEAVIETDSTTFNTSPLDCSFNHSTEGEFTLLNDTICYQELPYIFEYDKGYYDSSHWEIFMNDSLVYSASAEAPDLNNPEFKNGKLLMKHQLFVSGCEYYHEDSVFLVDEYPMMLSTDKKSICPDESALLSINNHEFPTIVTASWYDNQNEFLGTGDSLKVSQAGIYQVEFDNGFCQWAESISIEKSTEGCDISIYIPDAFTPNEDGTNDTWRIFSKVPVDASIEIYNRWGECIYTCEGNDCYWDGKFKGEDMPSGVYVYKVEVIAPATGEVHKETGTIELLR